MTPSQTASPAPAPDLSPRPLVWFAPLPPMPKSPGRMFTGSDDFFDLFEPEAEWSTAQSHVHVFKLSGEWDAYHASDAELRAVIADIRRRGLALAVEAGPLDPPPECGQGIEGFAGTDEGRLIANRILHAGGRIDLIALDEPLFFASIYDGDEACRWTPQEVAAEVGEYIEVMRRYFPEITVGDTEPLAGASTPQSYTNQIPLTPARGPVCVASALPTSTRRTRSTGCMDAHTYEAWGCHCSLARNAIPDSDRGGKRAIGETQTDPRGLRGSTR